MATAAASLFHRLARCCSPQACRAALIFAICIGCGISSPSARTLGEILASRDFAICAADDDLPFSTSATGLRGFHVDLAQAIADRLGVKLKIDWVVARNKVRFTNCDALMGSVVVESDVKALGQGQDDIRPMALSAPYMTVSTVLASAATAPPIRSLDDLKTLHVAVPSGSVSHMLMDDHGIPVWVRFRNDADILEAVVAGKADAGAVSQIGLAWHRLQNPTSALTSNERLLTGPGFRFDVAIGLRRTNGATVERINAILTSMQDDGSLGAILARYGIVATAR
jgi:polar amino acid transport system substrate-binding protein